MKKLLKVSAILAAFAMLAVVLNTNAQTTNNTVQVTLSGLGASSCTIDDYSFAGSATVSATTLTGVDGTLACSLYAQTAESVDMQVTDLVGAATTPYTIVDSNLSVTTLTPTSQNGSLTLGEHGTPTNEAFGGTAVNLFDKVVNHVGELESEVNIDVDLDAGTPADTYTGTGSVVITV